MKKMLFSCVLGLGIIMIIIPVKVNAAAYVGNTDAIVINKEANEEAITILEETDGLEDCPFPLEKLTTDEPSQKNQLGITPYAVKSYRVNASGTTQVYIVPNAVSGQSAVRINELVPVGFDWYQNGIPSVSAISAGYGLVYFNGAWIDDSGIGAYDMGYYWRRLRFYKPGNWGYLKDVWLSVWDKNDLLT